MATDVAVVDVDGVGVRKELSTEVRPPQEPALAIENYTGASLLRLEEEESDRLAAPFPDEALDVKPTGEVFVSQVHYRRRLNRVFGPGQWALVPRGKWTQDGPTMMREYVLYVRGHFVAEAVGECEYQESNSRMSWADAAEGCKSNALTRACKDLGIASECWDRLFANRWRREHCIHVWVEGQKRPQWRRLDAPPIYGEKGPTKEWAMAHDAPPAEAPKYTPELPREEQLDPEWPNDTTAHERHGVEPPRKAEPKPGGPKAACPQCGKPASPSKYPKPGKTHYCYTDKLAFEPGVSE
jgi:hypothetical protein